MIRLIHRFTLAILLLFLFAPMYGIAQQSDSDAFKLLQDVTWKYDKATSSHIESVTETRQSGEMYSSWRKEIITAYEAPGNRYRFGGRNSSGSGLVVSDGTTEWELHEASGEYIKRPAGTYGHPFPKTISFATEGPEERNAYFLRRNLGFLASNLKTAHWKPEETIRIGDQKIDCLVVSFGSADYQNYVANPNSSIYEKKVWIDKARKLIVKTEQNSEGKVGAVPHGPAQHAVEAVIYTVVSLDEPIPDEAFTFTPPADAKLVENFTDPLAKYQQPATVTQRSTPPAPPNYVGTPAPKLILSAADGKTLDLATLRGQPVLIDLWATWCGPCLMEMPTIDRIFRSTKSAGLVVLGLDQDKNPEDALAYLKNKNYGWADYHDGKDGKYTGLNLIGSGIPVLLLINAEGKIAYVHSGDDDVPGLLAAVRGLGPAFAAAMDEADK